MKPKHYFRFSIFDFRFAGRKLGALLLFAALARAASAVDAYGPVDPNAVYNYTCPPDSVPTIDATNFLINNSFTINFASFSVNTEFYEPWDAVNYTNYGTMMVNSGFKFDTLSRGAGLHSPAGSFYNAGEISCGSLADTGVSFFSSLGQLIVSATNVVNPGLLDVGPDDFIQLTGQQMDLSHGVLIIEGGGANPTGSGVFGLNTNYWDPSLFLGPTYAESAFFPIAPFFLDLTNSTPHFQQPFASVGPTYTIIRAVFIQDTSVAGVTNNIYFEQPADFALGSGDVTVEWTGSYLDPASGQYLTNYLYLNDDYVFGASTNVQLNGGGYPDNFILTASPTKLDFATPAPAGFLNVYPSGAVTNRYAFMNANLIGTTEATNASLQNPSGALSNLLARIQIMAGHELNLNFAQITGPNYMSVTATNQFDGSGGALVAAPYSDLNLAVTNGFLSMSNLLEANIPTWSGTIQAWNTRWLIVATNTIGTNSVSITNDFRVLLVGSQLIPVTQPTVQNLRLHATNSLVISDVLNVIGTCYIDAQNLTLTTNLVGFGATSVDGELNLNNPAILWPSALPNLRNLTNNGAIRTGNLAIFGTAAAPYNAFINNGLLSDQGSTIYANNFLNTGTITNGTGSFNLSSLAATLTNGSIAAGGGVSITSGSLVASNLPIQAGRSLTLQVTNLLTDTGVTSSNFWSFGTTNGTGGQGVALTIKPAAGDLLGTTITNYAPGPNHAVNWAWAGQDFGVSDAGYTNNVAVGRLILNAAGPSSIFNFTGTGVSNAIYVDYLELDGNLTNGAYSSYDFSHWLAINTNLVIYFAQAVVDGVSVAENIDFASVYFGANGGILDTNGNVVAPGSRWVPTYAGHFSSTNIVYPDGTTNTFNAALASSPDIDSDGDGIGNAFDPTPFFIPSEVNFTVSITNRPPLSARVQWATVANATNYVYYSTNLLSPVWLPFTNFNDYYYGANLALTNAAHLNWFISPQPWPSPATNVWLFDPLTAVPHYYRVMVQPWLTYPY